MYGYFLSKGAQMTSMKSWAPGIHDKEVVRITKKIGVGTDPVYLDSIPEPYAQVSMCFPAVEEKVSRDGGNRVIGWEIWKTEILIEAQFHAVWSSPKDELIDITPKPFDVSQILFLPDPNARYVGAQVDSVRINITENRMVDDLITVSETIFRITNKGERAFEYEVRLRGTEADEYQFLVETKAGILWMIQQGLGRNGRCFCDGGKYKRCHGAALEKLVQRMLVRSNER
jgi:hypothetical protein